MKKIIVLGSTGSIGISTLEILRRFPGKFCVEAVAANKNIDLLEKQIHEFKPGFACVNNKESAAILKNRFEGECKILEGPEGLLQIASECEYDIFLGAMVGFCGLAPAIEAIKRGRRIALANKETLVVAGSIIKNLVEKHNAELIPVDSEHSAIFQCLVGENPGSASKLILTASGGPFLNKKKEELDNVTINEALNHPNWKMGNKITIDSATMMNKGLEVIEAYWLFGLPINKIDVVVHPQSVIHSLVEFADGSIKAQLSMPDMKLPIQYALSYPERLPAKYVETSLPSIKNLTFMEPDFDKFECLKLAFDAIGSGGTATCILNASNEVAVSKFLNGEIGFTRIPGIINESLTKIQNHNNPDIETIFECDKETRLFAEKLF
jgi:1-deoxy-D-xylulose-5-phosphate reductoisomerase